MSSNSITSTGSTGWLTLAAAMSFVAISVFVMSKHLDEAVGGVIEDQEPELGLPLAAISHERPATRAIPRDEEGWDRIKIGSLTMELPGEPVEDTKPGWFSRYEKARTIDAFRVAVDHRQCHVRVSAINYSKGQISLNAAALAAKYGMDSELRGVTTIFPFDFRDLPARQLNSRPIDLDDLTRMHTFLILHNNELLILTVNGLDQHPSRLAHEILRTVKLP